MEIKGPNPKPLTGIAMAWPAIDGKAFAIRLQTPDGDLDLELNDTTLKQLLQALLQSSAACAPTTSPPATPTSSSPTASPATCCCAPSRASPRPASC